VQVSPVDIQAWASDTGSDYPATAAEKAAVLPAVAAWKAEQLADAKASRGQNAVNPLAAGLGAAGLGIAGLIAFNHFRKQGLSEPEAAAMAKQAAQKTVQAGVEPDIPLPVVPQNRSSVAGTQVAGASYTPLPVDPQSYSPATGTRIAVEREANAATQQKRQLAKGERTGRLFDFAALSGANMSGTLQARARGEYDLKSLWNDPDLGPRMAAADTPELQQALLKQISTHNPELAKQVGSALADRLNKMTPVASVASTSKLPHAGSVTDGTLYRLRDTNEILVSSGNKWESASTAGVRARLAPSGKAAYGSTTAEEEAQAGSSLQQGRRTSGKMFQPGYQSDPVLLDDDGNMLLNAADGPLYISSDYSYKAARAALLAKRSEKAQGLAAAGKLREAQALLDLGDRVLDRNTGVRTDGGGREDAPLLGYSDREDELTKGMIEALPASRVTNAAAEGWNPEFTHQPATENLRATAKPAFYSLPGDVIQRLRLDKNGVESLSLEEAHAAYNQLPGSLDSVQSVRDHLVGQPFQAAASPAPSKIYWGSGETGKPFSLLPQKSGPSLVDGMQVETRKVVFVPDPSGKTRTVWNPKAETFQQQPVGRYEPVFDEQGQPVYARRPATVQDLIEYTPGNNTFDAPPYKGKVTAEMVGAADTPQYDYTRQLDGNLSAGTYAAALADGVVTSADGKPFFRPGHTSVTHLEKAPVFQPGFILKEPKDVYSRALAAANELESLGGPPANVYSRYGVDQALVDQARAHVEGDWSPAEPRSSLSISAQARPVGGHTSSDWLTQVLSGMAVAPRPDAWTLQRLEKGATREDSAALAKGWLNANPGIAEVLSSNLDGVPVAEQLNLVQEALGNAAADFPQAVAWAEQAEPELAARAKLGGPGSFGFDQFSKSYVRKAVLGAVAELKSGGGDSAANVVIPAAASELLALEARAANPDRPDMTAAINRRTAGAKSPIEALWKLDGVISDAASSNVNEGYTNGSRLAEGFFAAARPGDGSRVGALKERLGSRVNAGYLSVDAEGRPVPPTPGESMAARMPIAIRFGTNLAGAEGGLMNTSDGRTSLEVLNRAVHGVGVRVNTDPSVVDPALKNSSRRSGPTLLAQRTGGSSRSFAVNKTLDNQVKTLMGQRSEAKARFENNEIDRAQFDQINTEVTNKVSDIVQRQQLLDKTRVGNEALLMSSNREVRTSDDQLGRGYVFDYDSIGRVQALPDLAGDTVSYEQVLERPVNDRDEGFDRSTLDDSRIEEGQSRADRFPSAMDAPIAERQDSFARMSDAEAGPILQRLRDSQAQLHSAQAARARVDDHLLSLRTGEPARSSGRRSYVVPQAAQDQLNTLRSSLERPVTAAYSTQELDDARARHIMSYIQSAATPSFDKAGRQTSGWTGGDSHHGGARLAGRADRNVGAYNAPSEAMLSALALAARRRTGAL
jgi:hypothetical protein